MHILYYNFSDTGNPLESVQSACLEKSLNIDYSNRKFFCDISILAVRTGH